MANQKKNSSLTSNQADNTGADSLPISHDVNASDAPPYTPTVTTNLSDYAPGSTATITASGFAAGSTVKLDVEHATGAGADNLWGTPDDVLDTDTGEGHEPWYVTDGGAGDLDGQVNGSVTTSWYVNPDDSAGATFLLTATSSGDDRVFGTSDDTVATTSFTDSGLSVVATSANVTLDETAGLQNAAATPSPAGDADDNDILVTSLPSTFSTRLTALGAGTATGAALSGYTGAVGNTGSNAFTVTADPGASITNISFVDSAGAPLNGLDSGLDTLNGTSILLYTDANNDNIVLGRAGGSTGAIVFAAYIEETGSPVSGGKIWTVEYQPLKHPDTSNADDSLNLLNKVFIGASQDLEFSLANAPSGQNLFLMFTKANPTVVDDGGVLRITDPSIIATGKDPANQSTGVNISTGDTINTSQAGGPTTFGTNSQMITEQEGIRYSFVTGARQDLTIPNLDQTEADVEANIDFTGVFNAKSANFDVVQLQSGKSAVVKISAFSTAAESGVNFIDGYANDTSIAITNVRVFNSAGVVIENSNGSVNDPAIGITLSGGVATITGVLAGYQIEYTTASDHNRVLVENGAALDAKGNNHADFDVGGFTLVQASISKTEIGSKMLFEDDGPSISTTGTEPTLTVDETVLATNATQNFAANFTSAFGADGAGTLTYALGVVAGASGLVDTATNEAVNLSLNGTVVEGRTATTNLLVFTVSVAANGDVTLDQIRAVVHPDASNPDDSKSLTADNLVTLTATKTDGDGDSAQAALNIGQNLVFKDDGPSVSTTGTEPTLTVDETVLATNATQNFAANFNSSFGADGAGTLTYALGVVAGASGLVDTATNEAVNLSLNGTVVEGRTATTNLLVFTVSVAANGDVTLDQLRAVVHPNTTNPDDSKSLTADNLVTLTATITDKDGDSAHAALNIGSNLVFKDDGPSISTTGTEPTLTVDETVLATNDTKNFAANFSSAFGADGAGTLTYALGVVTGASGLVDTASGQAVNLSLNGGVVEGRTASSNLLVFTATVAANGDVTLDQLRAVVHPDASNPDDSKTLSADNLITLTATKTDRDGDSAQATLNIGQNLVFEDDGPSLAFGNLIGTGSVLPQYGFWDNSAGADGLGAAGLDISVNSQFTLVRPDNTTTTGTATLTEQSPSPDGNGAYHFAGQLTGDFDNNTSTANTSVDYTLTAYANGSYTLDLVQGFSSTIVLSTAQGSLGAGGPDAVRTLLIPTQNPPTIPSPSEEIVFFGVNATTTSSSIFSAIEVGEHDLTEAQIEAGGFAFIGAANMNVSTSGIGIGNNNLDGNGTAGINAGDESFVINPETLLTGLKVFIDNSVGGYTPATEELYYTIFYQDGTTSGQPTKVLSADLTSEAGGQASFLIEREGSKLIDAVQLTMGLGVVKIPVIQFMQETENLASDVKLTFNATLTDKDGDSASSSFDANLFANDAANALFDFTLVGTGGERDAFNVDLSFAENQYQVTGFDAGANLRDTLVLNGDQTAGVQIDNSGTDSIVTVAETGGDVTTITLVGVHLLISDIVYGSA
ncbi:hypothetical protein DFS28_112145 [Pseudomonas sp. 478]|uniref:DUF5801 repeats-in-toxin domain-containing protein n=1 Tax=unclassified Pseudomonas TaxID=196821 RepID=UPI000DAE196B|nr:MULTISPECIES: DUF5801 repeats-in-toxin domain-containing protein [unclassified Pseudomonas]PZW92133.1 hypothetical protein DFS28_112145 [Pseudomonas sp. 478]TCV49614.1 hypothetical protein EDB99_1113 [Pseudomonas sp. 460]